MSSRLTAPLRSLGIKPFAKIPERTSNDVAAIRSALAVLPDPVLVVGEDDVVLVFNDAAEALFPKLGVGVPLARHIRSPDILDAIAASRTTGAKVTASWLERVPVERLFEVSVAPVRDLDCGPVVLVCLHEISETRRVERMRVDFIANASHELRTPLSSLIGFIETLQGPARTDDSVRERFLAIMREQAQRMARLVDDLLSLSRIEQHLHLRPKEPVDLGLILRHISDTLSPLAQESGAELRLDIGEPIVVTGDRDELMRVAENLIENAIKYGASEAVDRRVEISARKVRNEGVISVRDFGVGIPQVHIPRLTERFYRVDIGQSRSKGGTGLGLALVKHIVARHRGHLKIESTRGEGSVFSVYLPLSSS